MGERGYYLYKNGEKVYLEEGITVLGEVLKNPDDDNIVEVFPSIIEEDLVMAIVVVLNISNDQLLLN